MAFVSQGERLGTGEAPAGFLEMAPDLAVEVVSPNDSASDVQSNAPFIIWSRSTLGTSAEAWLAAGTRLVWVVYPDTRSVTAYRSLHEAEVLSELLGDHRRVGPT